MDAGWEMDDALISTVGRRSLCAGWMASAAGGKIFGGFVLFSSGKLCRRARPPARENTPFGCAPTAR